jgi:type VI secretion system secreted protein Hcp
MAQADKFLKIDGIPGESQDEKHKGEIEVLGVVVHFKRTGSMAHGGGGGEGKVVADDLEIRMRRGVQSPKLWKASLTGEHIKRAVLTERKAGGKQEEFSQITLTDVIVSDYYLCEGADGRCMTPGIVEATDNVDKEPTEKMRLNFAKIETEYRAQKADGSVGPAIRVGYDLKQMRAF